MKIKFVNHKTKIGHHATVFVRFKGESDRFKARRDYKKLVLKTDNQSFKADFST